MTPRPTLSTALPKTGKLQAPPRYSLASLRDSSAQLAPLTRLESKEEVPGSDSAASATRFWVGLRGGVLSLEDLAQRGELTGLSAGRIDQYARQVSLSLSFQAMTAADASEVLHNVTTSTFTAAPVLAAGQDRVIASLLNATSGATCSRRDSDSALDFVSRRVEEGARGGHVHSGVGQRERRLLVDGLRRRRRPGEGAERPVLELFLLLVRRVRGGRRAGAGDM